MTGVSFLVEELGAKTLGLLHELVPKAMVIGVLINPSNPEAEREIMMMQEAARTLGLRLEIIRSATANEIDNAFPILLERRVGALIVIADPFFGSRTRTTCRVGSSRSHSDSLLSSGICRSWRSYELRNKRQ